MTVCFVPMTPEIARDALAWRYPPPYDFYNPRREPTDEDISAMLSPESPQFGVLDEDGALIGVIGTGIESQVPGGDYTSPAVDIGIGLHPDRCGRGLGREVVAAFIAFLEVRDGPATYRATIASFNERSQKTFAALGFTETTRFQTGPADSRIEWVIVTKERIQ